MFKSNLNKPLSVAKSIVPCSFTMLQTFKSLSNTLLLKGKSGRSNIFDKLLISTSYKPCTAPTNNCLFSPNAKDLTLFW